MTYTLAEMSNMLHEFFASHGIHLTFRHLASCTRAVQWKTGKVVLKVACKTDVIVCMVCEVGDL